MDEESLAALGELSEETSLRHASGLMTPAAVIARTNGREGVGRADLEEAALLFRDAKFSARLLAANADKYIT
jgi:RuvB-like protein 1 (pontin 52)